MIAMIKLEWAEVGRIWSALYSSGGALCQGTDFLPAWRFHPVNLKAIS